MDSAASGGDGIERFAHGMAALFYGHIWGNVR